MSHIFFTSSPVHTSHRHPPPTDTTSPFDSITDTVIALLRYSLYSFGVVVVKYLLGLWTSTFTNTFAFSAITDVGYAFEFDASSPFYSCWCCHFYVTVVKFLNEPKFYHYDNGVHKCLTSALLFAAYCLLCVGRWFDKWWDVVPVASHRIATTATACTCQTQTIFESVEAKLSENNWGERVNVSVECNGTARHNTIHDCWRPGTDYAFVDGFYLAVAQSRPRFQSIK